MPTKTRKVVEEKPEELEEIDYSVYLDKEPTDLQDRFATWIIEKTGYEPGSVKAEGVFRDAVQLATALRMEFQRSPENQEVLAERRAAAAKRKEERETAGPRKRGRKPKAAADDEPDEPEEELEETTEEEPEEAPKPRRRPTARKAAASTKTAAKAASTRTRRARPASKKATDASEVDEAPF